MTPALSSANLSRSPGLPEFGLRVCELVHIHEQYANVLERAHQTIPQVVRGMLGGGLCFLIRQRNLVDRQCLG